MVTPFFSVIIPSYNRAHFLQAALNDLARQTFSDFEIIVVDDGSTDSSREVVEGVKDSRVRYVFQENKERGAARNHGLELARGQFVTFFDSDDSLMPSHLQSAFEFQRANKPLAFHNGYEIFSGSSRIKKVIVAPNINQGLVTGNGLSCIGVFVDRSLMKAVRFREDRLLAGLEDWDAWLRVAARTPILVNPKVTGRLVQHPRRSVMRINPETISERISLFMQSIKSDDQCQTVYEQDFNRIEASLTSYMALHLAIDGGKKSHVVRLLSQAVKLHWGEIYRKRFFVVLKLLAQ
ncbi:MAG: glycosyltransferase family 2 protein [Cyclobacteriaceae bacterium]|nr:glycosyltransferase family 2 protein [Cyclobacteriaceae bacterium]